MNYLQFINRFWSLRREVHFSNAEADLYYYLLHTSNSLQWKNPFQQSNALICATIGVSEKTLITARNRLKQVGLIEFEAGHKRCPSLYTLILENALENFQYNEHPNGSITGSITGSIMGENSPDIFKHKQNKEESISKNRARASPEFVPPAVEEVVEYGAMSGVSQANAEAFWAHYDRQGWLLGNGLPMVKWSSALQKWKHGNPEKEKSNGAYQQRTTAGKRSFDVDRIRAEDAEYQRMVAEHDEQAASSSQR